MLKQCAVAALVVAGGTMTAEAQSILPDNEQKILARVAQDYGLTDEGRALLFAIRRVENGGPGKEMGVERIRAKRYAHSPVRSLLLQGRYAAGTIRDRFNGDLANFAGRWCPVNKETWLKNARFFMERQGYGQ